MKNIIIVVALTIAALMGCGSQAIPEGPDASVGLVSCHGDVYCDTGNYCCPSATPYCGEPETDCPVGSCCASPPQ